MNESRQDLLIRPIRPNMDNMPAWYNNDMSVILVGTDIVPEWFIPHIPAQPFKGYEVDILDNATQTRHLWTSVSMYGQAAESWRSVIDPDRP